jgi:hypothetical protein
MDDEHVSVERTPSGRRLVVSRHVDATREKAWELLTDTERWPAWGPTVADVECDSRFVRSGTRGRVKLPIGVWVPFEVTTCADFRWTWKVARIPATGHRVEETPGGCRVCFEIPLVAAGYAPVCGRALGNIAKELRAEINGE